MQRGERSGDEGECKNRRSATAPAACSRGLVVKEYERQAGRFLVRNCYSITKHCRSPLPVLPSFHHGLRHILDCRCSARGNLHLDLHLAAGHHAVLVAHYPFLRVLLSLPSSATVGCKFGF
eukprot:289395-Pleurochrysis_carterae.AAC.1